MISLEEYQRLKYQVDKFTRDADRSAGVQSSLQERLKKEFGCDSMAKAEKLLVKEEKEAEKLEKEAEKMLAEFKADWVEGNGKKKTFEGDVMNELIDKQQKRLGLR